MNVGYSKIKAALIFFSLALLPFSNLSFQSASAASIHKYWLVVDSAHDGVAEISIVYEDSTLVEVSTRVYVNSKLVCTTVTGKCTIPNLLDGVEYWLSAENTLETRNRSLVSYTSFKSVSEIQVLQDGLFSLQASTGIWNPTPTFSYKWFKNGQLLPNENQSRLYLKKSDLGNNFQVQVSTALAKYQSREILSSVLTVSTPPVPCLSDPDTSIWLDTNRQPTVSGKPIIGEKLRAFPGVWNKDTKLCSFWYSNGKAIGNSGSQSYIPTGSDAGKYLQYVVVGTQKDGTSSLRFSNPIKIQKKIFSYAKAPTISGSLALKKKLTGVYQTWESGTTFTTSWLRLDEPISNATKSTYVITEQDLGKTIAFQICGSKKDYETKCLFSSKLIPLGYIMPVPKVSLVSKTSQVGDTLTVNKGSWPTGVTVTISWLRNSTAIEAMPADNYTISTSDRGSTLSATLTASKPGYRTVILQIPIGRIP